MTISQHQTWVRSSGGGNGKSFTTGQVGHKKATKHTHKKQQFFTNELPCQL